MSDETGMGENTPQGGEEGEISGQGGEGRRAAEVTPPLADDAEKEQTQVPAPPDDELHKGEQDPGHP